MNTTDSRPADRISEQFGRWTIIGVGFRRNTQRWFLCRCECGHTKHVPQFNLSRGQSTQCKSCGSRQSAETKARATAKRRGLEYIPVGSRVCPDCGDPTLSQQMTSTRCQRCYRKSLRGVSLGPWKHPQSIGVLAVRFGVTRQAVHHHIKRKGWDQMLAYYGATA